MADRLGVRLKFNHSRRVRTDTRAKLAAAIAGAAHQIEAGAKTRAPVDTGNLRNSISADQIDALSWAVTVGALYGAYVEFGTRHQAPRPFLIPAVDAVRPQFEQAIRRALK